MSPSESAELGLHVGACAACQQTLEQLTDARGCAFLQTVPGRSPALEASNEATAFLERLQRTDPSILGRTAPFGRAAFSHHGARLHASDRAPRPVIPDYEIMGLLGQGGMAVVYKARHVSLNRLVALKLLAGGSAGDTRQIARFRKEAEAAARLQHPHIVQIYAVGDYHNLPYLALELVDGPTLAEHLSGRPVLPDEAARLLEILARAMSEVRWSTGDRPSRWPPTSDF